jgi:hypothetical protein
MSSFDSFKNPPFSIDGFDAEKKKKERARRQSNNQMG